MSDNLTYQQIDKVSEKGLWKAQIFAIFTAFAITDSGDAKNMADKSTNINIFIIWEAL